METRRNKNRNRNLFLPLHNQMNDYMKVHDQKVQEYQNYLNYLHFNIINNSRHEQNQIYNVPPPTSTILPFPPHNSPPPATPVSLAFSHLSSPPPPTPVRQTFPFPTLPSMETFNDNNEHDKYKSNCHESKENIYFGEEANVWGPGLLGLFAKTPNQLELLTQKSHTSTEDDLKPTQRRKLHPIQISESTAFTQNSLTSSPSSAMPPGFEHTYSADALLREEMFMGNRSI